MAEAPVRRIAWFTPLRPVASGISLYSEELLEIAGNDWPIDVFVDGYTPKPFAPFGRLRVFPARQFKQRDAGERYAMVVYQFGNSPAHAYMYDLALRRPGVVVLHDTVLHHLMLSMVPRRGGAARYREVMRREYGDAGLEVAARVLQGRLPHALFDYPLSQELIRRAHSVVVHGQHSREHVRAMVPEADVSVVPMGIQVPPVVDRDVARAVLNLPPDVFVIASVTAVNPYKRLDVVLRAVSRLRRTGPVRMLIAGSVSPHVPLERWVGLYGLDGVVERLGFVDDRTARLITAAADVLVNLRYPTAGETSASLLRLMAAGRPVLVSDAGSFRELPNDVVAKVPVDALEGETIEALLDGLRDEADLARRLGHNARDFILRQHTLKQMVEAYRNVLSEAAGLDLPMPADIDITEHIDLGLVARPAVADPLVDTVARGMAELGLAGDGRLQQEVARSLAALGLSPDKM